jgi:signal transduction histidine kinase/CheY-like chemotaxis protein
MLAFTLLATVGASIAAWMQGQRSLIPLSLTVAGVSVVCACWAGRTGHTQGPMRVTSAALVCVLSWLTRQQGPALPAAAWWLSVMPFVLAIAGLYAMAIGTVACFVGILSLLFYGPALGIVDGSAVATVEPWRRSFAAIGSEFLGLGAILISMRRRSEAARLLEAARTTAMDALAAKTRFFANMSHEIRTPLNGLIGTAQLLNSPLLNEARRTQLLGLQEHSAKALLALVNDVLDWSKIEAGKVVLQARPMNPRRIVSEVNELFAVQAYAKGIELTSSCNPDVPRSVIGDAARLGQVVNNLVGNAVKFTASGGVHIHLSLESPGVVPPAPQDCKLRIEVTDSGIGIAAGQLATLFDPFTQADETVARRHGGTGLGLAISRDLAEMMGGRIEVASVPGRGSTFSLILPFAFEPDRQAASPPPRRDVLLASASPGVQRHLRTVLHDLDVDPLIVGELPLGAASASCRLLLIDAPLLTAMPQPRDWLQSRTAAGVRVVVVAPLGAELRIDIPDEVLRLYKPVRRRAMKAVLDALDAEPSAWAVKREFMPTLPVAGPHVLIAEDNPVNQIVVQAMLGELGATGVIAANGREALLCLAAERFDLVLMDMQMPVLDGLAATRAWREVEATRPTHRLPVVAMTAHAPGDEASACLAAGMDAYLAKPFGMAELRGVLETWCRSPTAATRLPPQHGGRAIRTTCPPP